MTTQNEFKNGILLILEILQEKNTNIGGYVEHFINEKGRFTVLLDDGHLIEIGRHYASDFGNGYTEISNEEISNMLATYRSREDC